MLTLEIQNQLIEAIKMAYRKHHLGHESIGEEELGNILLDALCNAIGSNEFHFWIMEVEKEEYQGVNL